MTITQRVKQQLFSTTAPASEELIRLPPTVILQYSAKEARSNENSATVAKTRRRTNLWSVEEHELFLRGLEEFPLGPWKKVAAIVETKNTRQTMTHAQKYRQKIERHRRAAQESTNEEPFGCGLRMDMLPPSSICSSEGGCTNSPIEVDVDFSVPILSENDLSAFLNEIYPFCYSTADFSL